jgi:hypothetical protein
MTKQAKEKDYKRIFLGGNGLVKMECHVEKSLWMTGHPVDVHVRITNESKRKVNQG